MTKKEYATKEGLKELRQDLKNHMDYGQHGAEDMVWLYAFISFVGVCFLFGWYLNATFHPITLTQLAEAEGLKIECINYYDLSGSITDDDVTMLCNNPDLHPNNKLICRAIENKCAEYALRRHD